MRENEIIMYYVYKEGVCVECGKVHYALPSY
jgi:hypothetical protein